MSFVDFSRIGSARPDVNRHQKFSIASIDIKEKSDPYNFYSESDLTPIKPSGTPNANALKWFGIALGVIVSVAVVVTLIVCLVVFLGHGHKNDDNSQGRTTVRYQKDKHSSTPPPTPPPPPKTTGSNSLSTPSATTAPTTTTSTTTMTTTTTGTVTQSTIKETTGLQTTTQTQQMSTTGSATIIAYGTWSNWGPWTMCAVTCGNSVHSRYRTCFKNTVNDANCVGNFKEENECTTTPCPVYGTWTTWQSWSNCDATCGGGTQNRLRTCVKVQNTDIDCVGRSTQQQTCSEWACPDCLKVCTTGTLNSACDACECSTNVQGIVRNQNGGLLNNVSIAHESAPYRELTTTTKNGTFELNNVCIQENIILKRSGYQDTIVKITSSSVIGTMQLIQFPVITTQPKTHLRLEGESVAFCCNATGNPAVTSYEWLKNGNLINESLSPDDTMLILTDLKFEDSGNVVCRANSPVGAVFSDSVFLSVRANPDDFCSDAYERFEIDLPSDCIQADTNSVKYDIGRCSPKNCRKNNSNVEESCSVDKKYCCIPSGKERRIIQCSGYSFPLYVTTSCACGECEASDITLNGQAVGATSGLPLRFGTIEIDGSSVGSTGFAGDFSFSVPRGTTRIAVTFKDTFFNQFIDTLKIIHLNEELSGTFNVHVNMIEKSTPIDINSNVSNTLQLGNQNGEDSIASLTIPPNAIFYPNGSQYNGVVKASLNFFDPRNSTSIENAPGEFVTSDQEGQTQNLQTFGVFSLSLQDLSGSSLQIAGQTEIQLDQTFFETTSIGNLSDAKVWGLNSETGVWEEQATLTVLSSKRKKRQSPVLFAALDISAYRWFNIDRIVQSERCYFRTEVIDGNRKLSNYYVRVIVTDGSTILSRNYGYVWYDNAVWTMCRRETELRGYIGVHYQNKIIHIDMGESGLDNPARLRIDYQILKDNKTVSAKNMISDSGPFYSSWSQTFHNVFRFKSQSNEYSLKVLTHTSSEDAFMKGYSGHEVWYPPLNSYKTSEDEYRTCFIKLRAISSNLNANLAFRVISKYNHTTILGVHEKGLINGTACIEYRCSGQNPDFSQRGDYDFFRHPETYTFVRITPIGQFCKVLNESSELRTEEQKLMNFSTPKSNVYNTYFEANIPDKEYKGIYFHKSQTIQGIDDAAEKATRECYRGRHNIFSNTIYNEGFAVTFQCL